jgi:signal transduction histidine kinase
VIRTLAGRLRPLDLALAAAFTVFALVEEYVVRMPGAWWPYALTLFAALVLLRRLVPVLAIAASSVSAASVFYDDSPISYRLWQLVAMIIAAYTAGQLCPAPGADRRARLRGLAAGLFVLLTALVYWENDRTDPMAAFFFTLAPYALGVAVALQNRRLAETAAVRASIREQQAREAVTEERVRIARELHDTLLQNFHGLVLRLQRTYNLLPGRAPEAQTILASAIDDAARVITEARDTVEALRSRPVICPDLAEALEKLGQELAATQNSQEAASFSLDVEGEAPALDPDCRDEIYRIACEALRNAFAHARASRVEAEIRYDARHVRVRVRDDGSGIEPGVLQRAGAARHWGLKGMRERAKRIGGQLEVWSDRGAGTEVELTVPASKAYVSDRDRKRKEAAR